MAPLTCGLLLCKDNAHLACAREGSVGGNLGGSGRSGGSGWWWSQQSLVLWLKASLLPRVRPGRLRPRVLRGAAKINT